MHRYTNIHTHTYTHIYKYIHAQSYIFRPLCAYTCISGAVTLVAWIRTHRFLSLQTWAFGRFGPLCWFFPTFLVINVAGGKAGMAQGLGVPASPQDLPFSVPR